MLKGAASGVLVVGALGGLALGLAVAAKETVQQSFWTELLKIAAVAGLPLVALAVRLPRAENTTGWAATARRFLFPAFGVVSIVIGACLYEIAVTPKDGANPIDVLVVVATLGTGVVLGAVAMGVAADVLDKIDPQA